MPTAASSRTTTICAGGDTVLERLIARLGRISILGLPTGAHLTRYSMYRELAATVDPYVGSGVSRTLSISGSEALITVLGVRARDVDHASFPQHDLRDLHAIDDDSYDLVVSDQVPEHIEGEPRGCRGGESPRRASGGSGRTHHLLHEPGQPSSGGFLAIQPRVSQMATERRRRDRRRGLGKPLGRPYHGNWLALRAGTGRTMAPLQRIATWNDPDWPIVAWVVARKPHRPRP